MEKQILVGSKAFFEGKDNFTPKDTDTLVWTSEPKGFKNYRQTTISGRCTIEYREMSKDELLEFAMRDKANGLEFGKFLVPEFIQLIDMTIDDLKRLYAFYESRIDDVHEYQKIIYKSYIENNDFTLTPEQIDKAFESYLDKRKINETEDEKLSE